jgi:urate oxidase
MHSFRSGPKRSYYGKGDVIAYRLNRDGSQPAGTNPVFGANVRILIYGDAFWPTYTTGDNTGLIATDSMKNFIQRETISFPGYDLESYCYFLTEKFLRTYPQAEGAQVSAAQLPYEALWEGAAAYAPGSGPRAHACVELARDGSALKIAEARSGIAGFRLLRLNGSAFYGFVRDQYTTLPDIRNRPLHMWLDLDWTYTQVSDAMSGGKIPAAVREIVEKVFERFTSGSIQQIIYEAGNKILADIPQIAEVYLEANNRTWDTVVEEGDRLGVYTDARPPFGCLGLTLRR